MPDLPQVRPYRGPLELATLWALGVPDAHGARARDPTQLEADTLSRVAIARVAFGAWGSPVALGCVNAYDVAENSAAAVAVWQATAGHR